MESKVCSICHLVLSIEQFYKAGNYYQKNCKKCHNRKRTQLNIQKNGKRNAFQKQPEEIQKLIIKGLEDGKKLKHICIDYNLNYPNFSAYRRNGYI